MAVDGHAVLHNKQGVAVVAAKIEAAVIEGDDIETRCLSIDVEDDGVVLP